jgi:hypothetical protein
MVGEMTLSGIGGLFSFDYEHRRIRSSCEAI